MLKLGRYPPQKIQSSHLKQGQDIRSRVAPPHPRIYRVPPWTQLLLFKIMRHSILICSFTSLPFLFEYKDNIRKFLFDKYDYVKALLGTILQCNNLKKDGKKIVFLLLRCVSDTGELKKKT